MANTYFKSDDVKVYPCAYRGVKTNNADIDVYSRVPVEYNTTRARSAFQYNAERNARINTYIADIEKAGDKIIKLYCIIDGYYFIITNCDTYGLKLDSNQFLCIKTATVLSNEIQTRVLKSFEDTPELDTATGYFTGLCLSVDSPIDAATASLPLTTAFTYPISYKNIVSADGKNCLAGDFVKDTGNNIYLVNKSNKIEDNAKDNVILGSNINADVSNATYLGKYNDTADSNTILVVGNGDNNTPHNAIEITDSEIKLNNDTTIDSKLIVGDEQSTRLYIDNTSVAIKSDQGTAPIKFFIKDNSNNTSTQTPSVIINKPDLSAALIVNGGILQQSNNINSFLGDVIGIGKIETHCNTTNTSAKGDIWTTLNSTHEQVGLMHSYTATLSMSGEYNNKPKPPSISLSTQYVAASDAIDTYTNSLNFYSSSAHRNACLSLTNQGITTTGNITAHDFYATSDARKKENIESYKCDRSILDLDVKRFDFIDGDKNQIGCIAQDLQEICPEIVREDADGYLSIQENKLIYLLLNEVKELKKEIDELKRGE